MGFGNSVTIVGNLTRSPELRYTPSGASVCNFGVAYNKKGYNGREDETFFFDVSCWGTLADNVAASLTKGCRVVVTGELEQRSWETPQGDRRSKVEIKADDVSPSLRWAMCDVTRVEKADNGFAGSAQPQAAPSYDPTEAPF